MKFNAFTRSTAATFTRPATSSPRAGLHPADPSASGLSRARRFLAQTLAGVALVLVAAGAWAHGYTVGDIRIGHPFATPSPPGAKVGAAYLSAENRGTQDDRLLKASSPAAARVEIHSGDIGTDGVMRMRELDAVPLPAGATTAMKPGQGNHLMLMELAKPLAEGDKFPMTLEFERAGKVEVEVRVEAPKGGTAKGHGHGH